MNGPLTGRRLLVTRPRDAALAWARALEARGAETVVLPCVEVVPLVGPRDRARLEAAIAAAGWVGFSSARAVRIVADRVGRGPFADTRVAAVGPATAEAARARLGRADLVPATPDGESLGVELARAGAGEDGPILLLGSRSGLRSADRQLAAARARWARLDVCDTRPAPARRTRHNLAALGVDTVIVASPSAVRGLRGVVVVPHGTIVVALGPTTARAVRAAGLGEPAVAPTPDLGGLVEALR